MRHFILIIILIFSGVQLYSQDHIFYRNGRFSTSTYPTEFQRIGFWGQNLKPYLINNDLAAKRFMRYKKGRIAALTGSGLIVLGVATFVTAFAASDQSDTLFGPRVDDNKQWMVGSGATFIYVGTLVAIPAGIISVINLKRSVKAHNDSLESFGLHDSNSGDVLMKMGVHGNGLNVSFIF